AAKEPVGLVLGPGGIVERLGIAGRRAVAEREAPDILNHERMARAFAQSTELLAAGWVEGVDAAVAEVADQQVAAEGSKARRREHHAPRRVEVAARDEAAVEVTVGLEDVDKAVARAGLVIVGVGVLLGVADVELAVDGSDPERRVALRQAGIVEAL